MKILNVKTKPPYQILIGENILPILTEDLSTNQKYGKIAIISDSKVEKLYGEKILEILLEKGLKAEIFSFPEGEESKNINTVVELARSMLQRGYDRKDLIVALGGGVVGDIAGFLASIYLRGIPYVQVPTTLLSQVDSSVGGKTGVDLPEGKNLLGTFYQPTKVYIDVKFLNSLPLIELKNGLAEVIKYGCILKRGLFNFLKKLGKEIYKLNSAHFECIIFQSVATKAKIVTLDEKEAGLRRVLNFGHTLGHALEAISNYKVPHGMAVAVGMLIEAKLSEILRVNEEPLYKPIKNLLQSLEIPWRISQLDLKLESEQLLSLISKDKKVWKGTLTIVLLKRIGKYHFFENPPTEALLEAIDFCY